MLSSKATTFKKTQWPEYLTTLAIFATFASNPAANLENRVLSRPISLKGQLQKNLQEQEINLELFLLRKTFTDSMKNDLFRLNKHESSISEKNFEDRSPDLKSARKTEIKTVYILSLYFFSILGIGKHHCVLWVILVTQM